jgi:PTH1 family peptidyl-tRNA hydrolase
LPPSALWVVVDDLNLAAGKVRIRPDGSDGGHNGLKSIIAVAGPEFPRLRIGIGPVPAGVNVIDFVLGRFGDADEAAVVSTVPRAAQAVRSALSGGIGPAMSRFNG